MYSREILDKAYNDFLQIKRERGSHHGFSEEQYRAEFMRGIDNDNEEKDVIIEGDRLLIRKACIADSEFMSSVEQDSDNSPWVANWPLGWRIAKLGDEDFLQVIIELKDGTPIGFIIFRDMLNKREAVELKRIAIIDKGKGYGKETLYLAQKMAFEIFNTNRLYLHTKEANIRAQSIYKATGFKAETPDPCISFYMDRNDYENCK